ncbi:hypothetical protein [Sporosarcina sp. NCCP-2716]|uniref:hypothetical protein n=1 Tax=Sporosarcina sp. NCCP-2716 TaxID=2943679 RepID=UPI00204009F7|nr:hypothetical protein [Sporosarcina sp. NCCP-2716]
MQITPTADQLQLWMKQLVPDKDLFFLKEENVRTFYKELKEALIVPKDEFFAHSSYTRLEYLNSYMYWTVSKEAACVIIAPPEWIGSRTRGTRQALLELQAELSTGLLLPAAILPSVKCIPADAIIKAVGTASRYFTEHFNRDTDEFAVIRAAMWHSLDEAGKEAIIRAYAQMIDGWETEVIPETAPAHIRKYANRFPDDPGSNCLSAALFAITEQEWMLREWVHPQTFLNGLMSNGYSAVNEEPLPGDVLTWSDRTSTVQHATYYLERDLCFNKSGQTFFEPWKIAKLEDIQRYWGRCTLRVYRKCNEADLETVGATFSSIQA